MNPYIIPFEKLKSKDIEVVGGKNASIGEMISTLSNLGVSVPGGFATTSHAYRDFLAQEDLSARIADTLATLDVDDVERLVVFRPAQGVGAVEHDVLGLRLQPGQVVEGTISNIVDFGAFVDLDGIDGLIHISELSWSHVNHPSEILSIGDTVSVKVLDIDRQRQRISLGLKQTQEDPWQRVIDTYNIGDELEGTVTKVVTFGAFVEILDGVEGLVHISELSQQHVENPREIIQPGDEVRVKILEIDSERRRLSLSVKRVEDQILPVRPIEPGTGDLDDVPELGLSEDVFAESPPSALGSSVEGSDGGPSALGSSVEVSDGGPSALGSSVEVSDGGADIGAELPATEVDAEVEAEAEVDAEAGVDAEAEVEADAPVDAGTEDDEAGSDEPDAEVEAVEPPAGVSTSGPGESAA